MNYTFISNSRIAFSALLIFYFDNDRRPCRNSANHSKTVVLVRAVLSHFCNHKNHSPPMTSIEFHVSFWRQNFSNPSLCCVLRAIHSASALPQSLSWLVKEHPSQSFTQFERIFHTSGNLLNTPRTTKSKSQTS